MSIFDPVTIGPLALRNGFVKSATYEGMTPGGVVSDALVEWGLNAIPFNVRGISFQLVDILRNRKPLALINHDNSLSPDIFLP